MGETRTAHFYCGCFVGEPFWHNLDIYEPAECGWEGEVEVDWDNPHPTIECPECHSVIEETPPSATSTPEEKE